MDAFYGGGGEGGEGVVVGRKSRGREGGSVVAQNYPLITEEQISFSHQVEHLCVWQS